jgi:peptide/nickel transport system substrate-binding protein
MAAAARRQPLRSSATRTPILDGTSRALYDTRSGALWLVRDAGYRERGAAMVSITRRDALKRAASASVALGMGGALAACGSSSSGSSSSSSSISTASTDVAAPRRGGTLRIGLTGGSESDDLNPLSPLTLPANAYAQCLFDSLVIMTAAGQPQLQMAEEITPNKSATVWTIRLRTGIEFHDGREMTAQDVIYTFQQVFNPKAPGVSAAGLSPIDVSRLKTLDRYTVELPCKTPFATLIETLAIISYSYIIPVGFDPKRPVGTGPFMYVSFTPGQQAVFARFPNYWQTGKPYLDKLVLTDYSDETSQLNALVSGQVDVIDQLSATSIKIVEAAGKEILVSPGGGFTQFTMRVDQAPFDDVRVRQATRLVINRPEMMNIVFGGHGTLGNDVFGIWSDDYDNSLPQREQDIEQAKSLLKQAGHSNLTTELVTSPIAPGVVQAAQLLAQEASGAGMTINLRQVTPTEFFGPNYLKWVFAQDFSFYNYYLPEVSLVFLADSFYNETHFNDPHYTQLYDEAVATLDPNKRKEIVAEMQTIDYNQGGYIIPYFVPVIDGFTTSVHGIQASKAGMPLNSFTFDDVWLA